MCYCCCYSGVQDYLGRLDWGDDLLKQSNLKKRDTLENALLCISYSFSFSTYSTKASLVVQLIKDFTCNVGDLGSIPGLGRSPGEVKGYPLQYSDLESSMGHIVHGVTESDTTE